MKDRGELSDAAHVGIVKNPEGTFELSHEGILGQALVKSASAPEQKERVMLKNEAASVLADRKLDKTLMVDAAFIEFTIVTINNDFSKFRQDIMAKTGIELGASHAKFEECTNFEKLCLLAWVLSTTQPNGQSLVGHHYLDGGKRIKPPSDIVKESSGDCDELAVLFYQVAKQMNISDADKLVLVKITDKNKESEQPGHANLVYPSKNGNYIFDLTHSPAIFPLKFGTNAKSISKSQDLMDWEAKLEGAKRADKEFSFHRNIGQYFHLMKGSEYYDKNDWAKAESEYLMADRTNPLVLNLLGSSQMLQGEPHYSEAAANFIKAANLNPRNFDFQYKIANQLNSMKEFESSMEISERAFNLRPKDAKNAILVSHNAYSCSKNILLSVNESIHANNPILESDVEKLTSYSEKMKQYTATAIPLTKDENDKEALEQMWAFGVIIYSYANCLSGHTSRINRQELDAAETKIQLMQSGSPTPESGYFDKMLKEIRKTTN